MSLVSVGELAILLGMRPNRTSFRQTEDAVRSHADQLAKIADGIRKKYLASFQGPLRPGQSRGDLVPKFDKSAWVKRQMQPLHKAADQADERLAMIGKGFMVAGVVAQVAGKIKDALVSAVESMKDLVIEAADYGTQIYRISHQLGLSTQQTQVWGYIAEQSGSSLQKFATGIRYLENNMRRLEHGGKNKAFASALAQAGLTPAQTKEAMASGDGMMIMLSKVGDKLKEMGNTPEAGALKTAIFGPRASEVFAALDEGGEGLSELVKRYHELDSALSDKQVTSLKQLHGAIDDVKAQITGTLYQAVADIAPMITDLLHQFTAWFSAHKPQIKELLDVVLRKAVEIAQVLGKHLGEAFDWLLAHKDEIEGGIGAIAEAIKAYIEWWSEAIQIVKDWEQATIDAVTRVQDFLSGIPFIGKRLAGGDLVAGAVGAAAGGGGGGAPADAGVGSPHQYMPSWLPQPKSRSWDAEHGINVSAPTSVVINVKDVQQASQAHDEFQRKSAERAMRRAHAAVTNGR